MNKYNYKRFQPKLYYSSDGFYGPKPGEQAPDFTAYTLEGKEVRLSDFFGKPIVLEMGSVTCPVFVGVMSRMKKLIKEFPQVQFLVLYVREAHPGEKRGAHRSNKEKRQRAQEYKAMYKDPRTVLVDDVSGLAHTTYGLFPNSVYIIKDGIIFWRAKWNHPTELQKNLRLLSEGKPAAKELPSEVPGALSPRVFLNGGFVALWDFVKGFPKLIYLKSFKRR
ncbi:MAG: deiodinase-like protein [Candidatus Paceibacterota bacterium]